MIKALLIEWWTLFWHWLPLGCVVFALAVAPFKLYDYFIERHPTRSKPNPEDRE